MVDWGGMTPKNVKEFGDFIYTEVISKWTLTMPAANQVMCDDVNWVWFEQGPDKVIRDPSGVKVYGYTISNTRMMKVGYATPDQALGVTAFPHEVGHIIYGNITGNWDEKAEHEYIKLHGLR